LAAHSPIQAEGEWVDEMLARRAGWRGRKFHHLRLLDVRLSHTHSITLLLTSRRFSYCVRWKLLCAFNQTKCESLIPPQKSFPCAALLHLRMLSSPSLEFIIYLVICISSRTQLMALTSSHLVLQQWTSM
jgi:hypothetical protein